MFLAHPPRLRALFLLVASAGGLGSGCLEANPAHDAAETTHGESEASESSASAGSQSSSASESMSGSATSQSTGDGDGDGDGDENGDGDGDGDGEMLLLRNFNDESNCNEPLWCFSGDVEMPADADVWGQECFDSGWTGDYEIIEVRHWVAATSQELVGYDLELRARAGGSPGQVLETNAVVPSGAWDGRIDTAVEWGVSTPEFCVGFAATGADLSGAVGVAVDPSSDVEGTSFLRMQGGGQCDVPTYTDVIELEPIPTGNWCIEVILQRLP